jgi:uncharacterized membrane protein YbjE (DUF340 family)
MFNSVLIYLTLLVLGGVLSYKGIIHDKLLKRAGQMQMAFLYMLIFVMGIRLGMDEEVLKAIGNIGVKATVYTIGTISFGIVFVYFTNKFIINNKKEQENDY